MKIYDSIPRTGEVDLRAVPPEEVVSFFDTTIKEEDWLLHGGPEHYLYLEPQLAHDLYREEGCRTAIYATQISAQALYRATLNRRLRQAVSVFCREINRTAQSSELPLPPQTAGFESPDGMRALYAFAEPMYSAMMAGDTDLTTDGYVYACAKDLFVQEEGGKHADWQSYKAVLPRAVYLVGREATRLLYQSPGMHPRFEARQFSAEESADHLRASRITIAATR